MSRNVTKTAIYAVAILLFSIIIILYSIIGLTKYFNNRNKAKEYQEIVANCELSIYEKFGENIKIDTIIKSKLGKIYRIDNYCYKNSDLPFSIDTRIFLRGNEKDDKEADSIIYKNIKQYSELYTHNEVKFDSMECIHAYTSIGIINLSYNDVICVYNNNSISDSLFRYNKEFNKIKNTLKYKKYKSLKTKFTDDEVLAILNKSIFIGMSENAMLESLGKTKVNKSVGRFGVHKQYIYGYLYVYTENGIITAFQNQ